MRSRFLYFRFSKFFFGVLLVFCVCIFFLLYEISLFQEYKKGSVHVLDVGQGDSILIVTPLKQKILVDGGDTNAVLTELPKVLSFFDKNIDMLILTHPHSDHLMGFIEVLKRYDVSQVFFTGVSYNSKVYAEFLQIIKEKNIPLYVVSGEKDIYLGGEIILDVLSPLESFSLSASKNVNNTSVVFRLLSEGRSVMLLTGDAEIELEEEILMSGLDISAEILKVGHHGSRTASSSGFLRNVGAEVAVISYAEGNSFGHPHEEVLERLSFMEIRRKYSNFFSHQYSKGSEIF